MEGAQEARSDDPDVLEILCDASEFPESEEKLIAWEASDNSVVCDPRRQRNTNVRCLNICRAQWRIHSPPGSPRPSYQCLSPTTSTDRFTVLENNSYLMREMIKSGSSVRTDSHFDSMLLKKLPRYQFMARSREARTLHGSRHSPNLCSTAQDREYQPATSRPFTDVYTRKSVATETGIRYPMTSDDIKFRNSPYDSFARIYRSDSACPSSTGDLVDHVKAVIQQVDPEEPLEVIIEPCRATGGDMRAIADSAANRLLQFEKRFLFSERFVNNVTYLMQIAYKEDELFIPPEDLWTYQRLYSLKRQIWYHLHEVLPQLPVQKLINVLVWRKVFGDNYILCLLKTAFLPTLRRITQDLRSEGPTGVIEAKRMIFVVIGSLPDSFLAEVLSELLK
ncbi:hypothetical protein BIW11_12090 [Tropilaelaps mercedesae]|uniref:Uncharacterized protein n=1 Tax=Tropilaelaps mercedesae TaxID=418985 RepID=A0A1V9X835_9ACAR|nr:hypothetical protein BIW11_12090 [Tropilaelaps mercedesae]